MCGVYILYIQTYFNFFLFINVFDRVISEAEGKVGYPLNRFKPPSNIFILLTIPRRYFRFGSLCLLVLVSVSVLLSPSVCLDDI